jgi:hypothetical protein
MKEQAARQQVESKIPILTRTAHARVDELQALIDRYLDDEELNSYVEALTNGRAEAAEKAKAPVKRKRDAAGKVKEPAPAPATLPPPLPAASPVQTKDAAPKAKSTPKPNVPF